MTCDRVRFISLAIMHECWLLLSANFLLIHGIEDSFENGAISCRKASRNEEELHSEVCRRHAWEDAETREVTVDDTYKISWLFAYRDQLLLGLGDPAVPQNIDYN